jgi:hypothetical protein
MTEGEKSVLSLFVIGVLIVVGKVLAGGEPSRPAFYWSYAAGRLCLDGGRGGTGAVSDLPPAAVCGFGSMLGIAGYQAVEIAIQRRIKKGKRWRSLRHTPTSRHSSTCWRFRNSNASADEKQRV